MSSVSSAARLRLCLTILPVLLMLVTLFSAGGLASRPTAAQTPPSEIPIAIEDVELVAGCQIRAFMPHYRPGTPLFQIANDIEAGNPRFWFMQRGPVPMPTGLFDPASAERSVIDVLTEEAGYVCVDFGTIWHRPLFPLPPCVDEPPYCLPPEPPYREGSSSQVSPQGAVDVQTDTIRPEDDLLFTSIRYLPAMPAEGETWRPDVYAMDLETGQYHRLTFEATVMRHMAASPDRQKLALTRIPSDTNGDGRRDEMDDQVVWVVLLAAGKAWRLTPPGASGGAGGLDWLDDQTLVFNYRNSPSELYDIVKANIATGERTNLTNTPEIAEADVAASADGRSIVYVAVDSREVLATDEFGPIHKGKVWMMRADGSGGRQLTDGGPLVGRIDLLPAGDYDPELSPGNTHVSFGRAVELGTNDLNPEDNIPGAGTHHIFVVDVNTLAVQELTHNDSVALIPDWADDGTIYFTEVAVTAEHQAGPYLGIVATTTGGGFDRTEPFPPGEIWKGALVVKLIPPVPASGTTS